MSYSVNFRSRDCTVCFEAYEKGVTASFVGGNTRKHWGQLSGRKWLLPRLVSRTFALPERKRREEGTLLYPNNNNERQRGKKQIHIHGRLNECVRKKCGSQQAFSTQHFGSRSYRLSCWLYCVVAGLLFAAVRMGSYNGVCIHIYTHTYTDYMWVM